MKIGFIITARMKSSRLKKKAILKVLNRELIAWMIDRAKLSNSIEKIIIATSTNPQDDILEEIATREGIHCYRGSEDDVIERLYEAANSLNIDFFVNITADCPLFGYDYFDQVISFYKDTKADLIKLSKLPIGLFIYGIRTGALEKVISQKNVKDTEVWGPLFQNDDFLIKELPIDESLIRENYRLTVDYQEDFDVLIKIFKHFGEETYKKTTKEIISFLDDHPEVVLINERCKELYMIKWSKQEEKTKRER